MATQRVSVVAKRFGGRFRGWKMVLEVAESELRKDQVKDSDQWVKVVRKDQTKKKRKVSFLNVTNAFTNVNQTLNIPFSNNIGFGNKRDASDYYRKVWTK